MPGLFSCAAGFGVAGFFRAIGAMIVSWNYPHMVHEPSLRGWYEVLLAFYDFKNMLYEISLSYIFPVMLSGG
jgi:hypothetical protein